jgi:hypothetical protein
MTIKLITFKTNQTLIGEVVSETDSYITLKQPVQVVIQPTKEGPMMGFSPYLEFAEEFKTGISLPKDNIQCVTTPMSELTNQYNQVFGSGIQIASVIPKF